MKRKNLQDSTQTKSSKILTEKVISPQTVAANTLNQNQVKKLQKSEIIETTNIRSKIKSLCSKHESQILMKLKTLLFHC